MDERALTERLITYDTSTVEGLRACSGFVKGWLEAREIAVQERTYGGLPVLLADIGPQIMRQIERAVLLGVDVLIVWTNDRIIAAAHVIRDHPGCRACHLLQSLDPPHSFVEFVAQPADCLLLFVVAVAGIAKLLMAGQRELASVLGQLQAALQ